MQKEINLLVNILENLKELCFENETIYEGSIDSHDIILAKCGIGKVNAAVNTFRLIRSLNPDLVINSGVAGGAGLPIGSLLVAEKVAYDDVWCGPGTLYGQADGMPLFFEPYPLVIELLKDSDSHDKFNFGLICSGDKFISTAEEIAFIKHHFPEVKAVDMESAAIAQVCTLTNKPFAILRVVSDTPGEGENISQYKDFWIKAPEKTFQAVNFIIRALK